MSWKEPIRPNDPGEVGKVYYLNLILINEFKEDWTMPQPFTLNPERGKDIETMLKKSTEIPNVIKDQLMKKRRADVTLSTGRTLKLIISETPAPYNWGPNLQKDTKTNKIITDIFGSEN